MPIACGVTVGRTWTREPVRFELDSCVRHLTVDCGGTGCHLSRPLFYSPLEGKAAYRAGDLGGVGWRLRAEPSPARQDLTK